jgi:23S rRNA (guanosine2251-2'-O)-methyltransferase
VTRRRRGPDGDDPWIYGIHAVAARLALGADGVSELWLAEREHSAELDRLRELALRLGVPVQARSRRRMDEAVGGVHQGVALKCRAGPERDEADLETILAQRRGKVLLLALDEVTDPRNLGACLRSAEAFGADAVLVPRQGSAPLNAAAAKAASGSADRLPVIRVANLARTLSWLKQWGVRIVGTSVQGATPLRELDLAGPLALVMGSEDRGLRRLTRERCDLLAGIPLSAAQPSLNVSVATGICLYEIHRQRTARP